MSAWAIAILPLLGVVLGALLHFWLSSTADREKHREDIRTRSYADYLKAVAAAAHPRTDEDLRDAQRDAADAKARIAVYGSASVISALARFEETGAVLGDAPSAGAFVALLSSIRAGQPDVTERDLGLILLGTAQQGDAPAGAPRRR